eukprot:scaffold115591_cov32-Tisochrysis_lutea.AAC.4
MKVRHRARDAERFLRIVEHICHGVHPQLVIGDVHAHGLLAHGGLVRVTRRLVVIGEGNDGCADAEDHRRVDLAMGVPVHLVICAQVAEIHCDHHGLFFLSVDLSDVFFADHQTLVLHDENRPAATAGVGEEAEFARLSRKGIVCSWIRRSAHAQVRRGKGSYIEPGRVPRRCPFNAH